MVAKLKMLGDRVLIKPIEKEEVSRGGIILPDTAREKPQEGEFIAVGPGRQKEDGTRVAMDIKVGDRVLYNKWGGTEVKLDDEELLIMHETDIMLKRI